jgi:hypothetical protein
MALHVCATLLLRARDTALKVAVDRLYRDGYNGIAFNALMARAKP